MKILVATDGSDHAMKAVERALTLAEKEGAQVTLLSVAYFAKEDLDEMPPGIQDKLENQAKEALNKAKALFDSRGIPVKAMLDVGFVPANSIIQMAEEGHFDAILLGSRGSSKFKEVLFGSTAAKVTAHAPCSVTVVR